MGLRIIPSTGKGNYHGYRPIFYAQYRDDEGRVTTKALTTRLRGTPPESGLCKDTGDAAFEKAKGAAEQEFATYRELLNDKKAAAAMGCTLLARATGQKTGDMELAKLAAWYRAREKVRVTERNAAWLDYKDTFVARFAKWAQAHHCRTVFKVTPELAQAYCMEIAPTLSRETLKKNIYRLTGAFRAYLPSGMKNPFEGVYKMAANNMKHVESEISRKPLSESEVRALWECARKAGEPWYGVTVCATCTGMRIGDVCNLKWRSVNFEKGFITTPTAKTGTTVTLPLFDYAPESDNYHPLFGELRRVLDGAQTDADSVYVFPEAHATYSGNRNNVSKIGKTLFAKALFGNEANVAVANAEPKTPEEVKAEIAAAPWCEKKRTRIAQCYALFADGRTYAQILGAMGYEAFNRISMDLAEVERLTGENIRPQAHGMPNGTRALIDKTRQARTAGRRRASLYGWHSLRHSFVVFALQAGVPLETLRTLVGHSTIEMTRRYYNPTEEMEADRMRAIFRRRRRGAIDGKALVAVWDALPAKTQQALWQAMQAQAANPAQLTIADK